MVGRITNEQQNFAIKVAKLQLAELQFSTRTIGSWCCCWSGLQMTEPEYITNITRIERWQREIYKMNLKNINCFEAERARLNDDCIISFSFSIAFGLLLCSHIIVQHNQPCCLFFYFIQKLRHQINQNITDTIFYDFLHFDFLAFFNICRCFCSEKFRFSCFIFVSFLSFIDAGCNKTKRCCWCCLIVCFTSNVSNYCNWKSWFNLCNWWRDFERALYHFTVSVHLIFIYFWLKVFIVAVRLFRAIWRSERAFRVMRA